MKLISIEFLPQHTQLLKERFAPYLLHHPKIPYLTSLSTGELRLLFHPRIKNTDQLPQEILELCKSKDVEWGVHEHTGLTPAEEESLWVVQFFSQSKPCSPLEPGLPDTWKRVLSNFYPTHLTIDGHSYVSVEHFFQSQKALCSSRPEMAFWFQEENSSQYKVGKNPADAKRIGARKSYNKYGAVLDCKKWESVRVEVMKTAISTRFSQDPLFYKILKSTAGMTLLHFERAGARSFWGGCMDRVTFQLRGQNQLGQLLMVLRNL